MVSFDPYIAQLQNTHTTALAHSIPMTSTKTQTPKAIPVPATKPKPEQQYGLVGSYEEGWDRWDGPMWPKDTVQCDLQNPTKTAIPVPTKSKPKAEQPVGLVGSYEEGWDRWDGPQWPKDTVQCELQKPGVVMPLCAEHHTKL